MKTAIEPQAKFETVRTDSINMCSKEAINDEIAVIDFKFYQKLIVLLISLSTILIFPETPKELETTCQNYHNTQICNVF